MFLFAPDDTHAAPARLTPAPVTQYIAPASPQDNRDFRVLVNSQVPTFAVVAPTSKVVVSRLRSERIEEQIGNILVSPSVENTVEVVLCLPQERLRQPVADWTTLNIARSQPVQEQARVQ